MAASAWYESPLVDLVSPKVARLRMQATVLSGH